MSVTQVNSNKKARPPLTPKLKEDLTIWKQYCDKRKTCYYCL